MEELEEEYKNKLAQSQESERKLRESNPSGK